MCFKTTDSSRDWLTLHLPALPALVELGKKPQQPQEILRAVFHAGTAPAQGQHCAKLLLQKLYTEASFHCCFYQVSLDYIWPESFCGEDFTAAFYPLHSGNRLLGGRRNGNKSSKRQRRGDSWALVCTDTQVSALRFIYSLSGFYQRFTSLPNSMISKGGFFVSLTQEKGCRQTGRVGTRSSPLQANSDRLCLEIPSLQSQSRRAVCLMLSQSFGT